jgi:hypothetical protein
MIGGFALLFFEVTMFIPAVIKQKSDMLVVFDYPSYNDAKGHIQDSNIKNYFIQNARKMGLPVSNMSFICAIPYALGRGSVEDFILTAKKDKTKDKCHVNGFFFDKDKQKWFDDLEQAIEDSQPKMIICCSKIALILIAGSSSIDAFRGSMLMYKDIPVLVTLSPMDLYTRPEIHLRFYRDLHRASEFFKGTLSWGMPEFDVQYGNYATTLLMLNVILKHLDREPVKLSCDVETRVGLISFFGVAVSNRSALVIPFITWDDKSYWTEEQEVVIVSLLRKLLGHPNARIIGQNFQYDIQYIVKHWGVLPKIWRDTMVEAHVNWTKGQPLSLGFLSSMYCVWYRYWKEDGKDFHKSFQTETDWNQYAQYNAYDCCYTFEVSDALERVSEKTPREEVRDFQRTMQNIVVRPVLRGLRFDKAKQQAWKQEYGRIIASYQAWFEYIIPDELINKGGKSPWYNSPTKMMFLFYRQLGLEPIIDRKSKRPTVGDDALMQIGKQEPLLKPITDLLQVYRSLNQFYNLYLCASLSPDGRMRTQYFLAGTDTFRLSSKKDGYGDGLNLQNISKG